SRHPPGNKASRARSHSPYHRGRRFPPGNRLASRAVWYGGPTLAGIDSLSFKEMWPIRDVSNLSRCRTFYSLGVIVKREMFPNCRKFRASGENDLDGKRLPKIPALTLAGWQPSRERPRR